MQGEERMGVGPQSTQHACARGRLNSINETHEHSLRAGTARGQSCKESSHIENVMTSRGESGTSGFWTAPSLHIKAEASKEEVLWRFEECRGARIDERRAPAQRKAPATATSG